MVSEQATSVHKPPREVPKAVVQIPNYAMDDQWFPYISQDQRLTYPTNKMLVPINAISGETWNSFEILPFAPE